MQQLRSEQSRSVQGTTISEKQKSSSMRRPKKNLVERSSSSRSQQSSSKDSILKFKSKTLKKRSDQKISELISKYDSSADDLQFDSQQQLQEDVYQRDS